MDSQLFAYCNKCEKEIFNPKRKSFDSMYYNVWILAIIASLGLGLIPFLIYHYIILKKEFCPNCQNQLNFYNSREEIPNPKAEISRILEVIEQEKKEKEVKINCPYCQEEISTQETICSNCGASLKE